MKLGKFIDIFLALHVSGIYAHHQEHYMFNYRIWFSVPSFWMGGGLESRCVGRVYGLDGAVRLHQLSISHYFMMKMHGQPSNCNSQCTIRTAHTTYAVALKTTTHPKTRCRKLYDATQHLMLLMMCVCTRNMSS